MTVRARVPSCILELEKYWFLNGFLPLHTIVPPKPADLEAGDEPLPDDSVDSDEEAGKIVGTLPVADDQGPNDPAGQRRTWRDLATQALQPDPLLHAHLEELIQEMEAHEDEFIDPLHRPWRPREFLKTIENYIKLRCRADMNHCGHCGQMNPSEYTSCLRCRTDLQQDTLEMTITNGTVDNAMQLEGFRILPSPCIKYFLLCQRPLNDTWMADMQEVLRPLYFLFTRSRFLAGDMVADTTDHHVQAAADLNNLSRHLHQSLAKGKQIVEQLQQGCTESELRDAWSKIADAALEAQQNLCMMIDAWEEFEGVRLDIWWDEDETPLLSPGPMETDAFGLSPIPTENPSAEVVTEAPATPGG